jgi:quercetin dioxygenase-like cupin family protein
MGARKSESGADRKAALMSLETEAASSPRFWSSAPGDRFPRHEHPDPKVLFCLEGTIVFHTDDGEVALSAGDRLDLDAHAAHAATVGPDGCACVEAWRS